MTWNADISSAGNEARKCKYDIVRYTRGKVLDLGSGPWKPFDHFVGIDTRDEWTTLPWRPDIQMDAADLSCFASQSWDAVFSSHLLQILTDPEKALKEWYRVIKPNGYLVLYLPHASYYPSKGTEGANVLNQHDFLPEDVTGMVRTSGLNAEILVDEERNQGDEYSFLQVYQKRRSSGLVIKAVSEPTKEAIVLRYGGIGDSIQASSILPQLQEQGYHITFLTQSDGYEILKHDPHIDEFFVKERDQVPMAELGAFWHHLRQKYDRFINLTETVEVALLVVPGMTAHGWSKEIRHERFNVNYLEFTHKVAGLPYKPQPRFYATDKEKAWAKKFKNKHGGLIMWCVGSSIHKTWPYMDQALARILVTYPDFKVVLVGEELDRILDLGWENEPRILKKAGKLSIRNTLALAEKCDLVIGAETGILNAVSFLDIPKIVHLSHSSRTNLTRDWKNCSALIPRGCDCYPCHQLNATFRDCPRHDTGVAMCAGMIDIEDMWSAIQKHLK